MTLARKRRGQVTVETAVLFTFVIAGFLFMAAYLQRAAQGGLKGNADSLGQQFSVNQPWKSVSIQKSFTNVKSTASAQCSDYSHGIGKAAARAIGDCAPGDPPTTAPTTAPGL